MMILQYKIKIWFWLNLWLFVLLIVFYLLFLIVNCEIFNAKYINVNLHNYLQLEIIISKCFSIYIN